LIYYFAYGSNLHVGRMLARIPEVNPVEAALLRGYILRFHKRGRDGSGKCNIRPRGGATVAGVIYRLDAIGLARLDRIEGRGYRRLPVVVSGIRSGRTYRAHCYAAKACAVDAAGIAYEWYRDIVVAGAEAHELPAAYVERLRATPARPDPNPRRHRQQAAVLMHRGKAGPPAGRKMARGTGAARILGRPARRSSDFT